MFTQLHPHASLQCALAYWSTTLPVFKFAESPHCDYTEHLSTSKHSQQVKANQIDVYHLSTHCRFCRIVHAGVGRFAPRWWHDLRGQAITQSEKIPGRRKSGSLAWFCLLLPDLTGLISVAKVEGCAFFADGDFCVWLIAQWEAKIRPGCWVIFQPCYCLCAGHDRYPCRGQPRKGQPPIARPNRPELRYITYEHNETKAIFTDAMYTHRCNVSMLILVHE